MKAQAGYCLVNAHSVLCTELKYHGIDGY